MANGGYIPPYPRPGSPLPGMPGYSKQAGDIISRTWHWNRLMSIVAAATALVGAVGATGLYMFSSGNDILRIGAVFGLVALCVLLACSCCDWLTRRQLPGGFEPKQLIMIASGTVLVVGLGCLFQFLYSIGTGEYEVVIDDYVFVVDDSGSMEETDPQTLRIGAFTELLNSLDGTKRAGFVRFTDFIVDTVPVEPITSGHRAQLQEAISHMNSEGGTNIQRAIEGALSLNGMGEDGRSSLIVLLSDGGSWVNTGQLAQKCAAGNSRVCSIALTDSADWGTLERIATSTGGMFYPLENIDQLADTFTKIHIMTNQRDLLGVRPGSERASWALGLLRVLFIWILGALVGIGITFLFEGPTEHTRQLVVASAAGLLCALLVEVGNLWFLPTYILCPVALMLMGANWLEYEVVVRKPYEATPSGGHAFGMMPSVTIRTLGEEKPGAIDKIL